MYSRCTIRGGWPAALRRGIIGALFQRGLQVRTRITALILLLGFGTCAVAQQDFSDVTVEATPIRDGLYLITGRGGNIVASTGEDGTFLVDDQYAPLTGRIQAALDAVTDKPVRFVIERLGGGFIPPARLIASIYDSL